MRSNDGFTVIEALAALALAGLAFGALAAATATATHALRVATSQQAALAVTTDRLELLRLSRAGPGTDVVFGPPPFLRTWARTNARGRPARLTVAAVGGDRQAVLDSEVWP